MKTQPADMLPLLNELRKVFTVPAGSPPPDEMARIYARALEDIPLAAVRAAVDEYLYTEERFWPKPATLRRFAKRHCRTQMVDDSTLEGRYQIWINHGMCDPVTGAWTPCPVCGSIVTYKGSGRFWCYHSHDPHMRTGLPYSGPRGVSTGPRPTGGSL